MNGLHIPWALIAWTLILLVPIAVSLFVQAARTPKRPAGVEPLSPERLPLPGPGPAHPHDSLPPDAGAPVPPVVKLFDFRAAAWECGCLITRDHLHGRSHHDLCERHKFAAEWNERLRQ